MTDSAPYTVPEERGRWRALTLAALVHIALLVFLWIGVRWQNETPATIEAEVWSPQPREAAPVPEPINAPEPKPEPVTPPEPKPEPKPTVQEAPKPKVEEPPVAKPDIALEREKKRKIAEEKKRREEEEERKEKLAEEKKRRDEELAKEKKRRDEDLAKEKRREQEKREHEEKLAKAKQEEARRLEKEKADKAEAAKKIAAEKKRQQEEADNKLAQKMREEDLRRMTGAGGTGDAPKAQGGRADGAYSQRIAAKIRSNITFIVPEGLQGNPPVEYEVRLLPDGSVAGMRKLRSSGVQGFDDAVARAIERSQPFPKDSSGSVPTTFIGHHKPKDQ